MAKRTIPHIKLGIFVLAGIAFLILLLYIIGKNQNLFGKTFMLKARFENTNGLMRGNNIRFAGIDAGTVKSVNIINDTTIEVILKIRTDMKNYIRQNATVSITTDGLMGNKLVNIQPVKSPAPLVQEGDILLSEKGPDTDEMLKVLSNTNNDLAFIAKELKQTVQKLNNSKPVWDVLNDASLPLNIRHALVRLREASDHMNTTMTGLEAIVYDVRAGKGSVGQLLTDTTIAGDVKESVARFRQVSHQADTLAIRINGVVDSLQREILYG
ncbi:MAG TPA: MlaD family protein, partial [Chitinophagaceae bacterium]